MRSIHRRVLRHTKTHSQRHGQLRIGVKVEESHLCAKMAREESLATTILIILQNARGSTTSHAYGQIRQTPIKRYPRQHFDNKLEDNVLCGWQKCNWQIHNLLAALQQKDQKKRERTKRQCRREPNSSSDAVMDVLSDEE